MADPLLAKPSDTAGAAGFRLRPGSPAIASGTDRLAPDVDFDGKGRVRGKIDRGAFRYAG